MSFIIGLGRLPEAHENPGWLRPEPSTPRYLGRAAVNTYMLSRSNGCPPAVSCLFAWLQVVQRLSYSLGWHVYSCQLRQQHTSAGQPGRSADAASQRR